MDSYDIQPEGNYYDKYHSSNPIVRKMMSGFFKNIAEILCKYEVMPKKILEAGCGEGEVTKFLSTIYPEAFIDAFDISDKVVSQIPQAENEKINFWVGNIYNMLIHAPYSDERIRLGGGTNWWYVQRYWSIYRCRRKRWICLNPKLLLPDIFY